MVDSDNFHNLFFTRINAPITKIISIIIVIIIIVIVIIAIIY